MRLLEILLGTIILILSVPVTGSNHGIASQIGIYDIIGIIGGLIIGVVIYFIILRIIKSFAEKEAKQKIG